MFKWYENELIKDCVTHKIEPLSLHDYMDIVRPYWEQCTNHVEGTLYSIMQIHSMVLSQWVHNHRINVSKSLVMKALQWKQVFEMDNSKYQTPSDLYLHYPHNEVSKIISGECNYHWVLCDMDYEVLSKNFEKVGWQVSGNRCHLESLVDMLPELCEGLKRRYLKVS